MEDRSLLPGLPRDMIRAAYLGAPGDEIESGKFASPESSAALVANAFGLFLTNPATFPALPGTADCGWPAKSVALEAVSVVSVDRGPAPLPGCFDRDQHRLDRRRV